MKKSLAVTIAAAALCGSIAQADPGDALRADVRNARRILSQETRQVAEVPTATVPVPDGGDGGDIGAMVAIPSAYTYWAVSPILIKYFPIYTFTPTWKCKRADGTNCDRAMMTNPWYRQVVIMPTGFQDTPADREAFWAEFDKTYTQMSNAGTTWSTVKKSQILYIGYFIPGGALGAPDAAFSGMVAPHPIRAFALSLSNDAVYSRVNHLRSTTLPELNPMCVGVLFNTFQDGITANAAPPNFINRAYGVAKWTRQQNNKSAYIGIHELAHAGLSFLDEYVETGFENMNIRTIDAITPLILFDGSWGGLVDAISDLLGVYDYNVSEILAGNGNVNIALSRWPATVNASQDFLYEGGMFFGRGTYHMSGNNVMDGGSVARGPGDEFAYAQSPAQRGLIDTAFGAGAPRANDRLRNAGPKNGWPLELGGTTSVMMYDGDKLNHFHPTRHYTVEVGWYERNWRTCWWGFVPYPCYDDVWTTARKTVYPQQRSVDLRASALYGLTGLTQTLLCAVGFTEVPKPDGTKFKLCEQGLDTVASAFLPTFKFNMPYQNTTVPASQWFTTYWWRFQTNNGTYISGFTGWSSFYRSL